MDDFNNKLKENGMLLKSIPAKERTEEYCNTAVNQNPRALQYVPSKKQSEEICKAAMKQDPTIFRFIKERNQTQELCEYAVSRKPDLLKDIPTSAITEGLCRKALSISIDVLPYVPKTIRETIFMDPDAETREKLLAFLREDFRYSRYLPASVRDDHDILNFQKQSGCLLFGKKYYDTDQFIVRLACVWDPKDIFNGYYIVDAKFSTFDSYYHFLDGDLKDTDLRGYDFKGVDLHKYTITGAVIDSSVLDAQGLYDGRYWHQFRTEIEESETAKYELFLPDNFYYPRPVEDNHFSSFDMDHITVFYISDIHLEWKIGKHFKDRATREEIHQFVRDLAEEMVGSVGTIPYASVLLVAGDTSHVFELNEVFYRRLSQLWRRGKLIVISGNHELWDPVEGNIAAYKEMLSSLSIHYLQNELVGMDGNDDFTLSETEILSMSMEELREKVRKSTLLILGGIGFSGLNEKYNATNLNYGPEFRGPDAREKDIAESERFNRIYQKLLSAAPHSRVIVLTHMPKLDWNADPYNPNWLYVSGHNHRNYLHVDEKARIYSDNQIGYKKQHLGLKYFRTDNNYDIFAELSDGIHKITLDEYQEFNIGKRISMNFSKDGEIYALKKNGNYMFLFYGLYTQNAKQKKLYVLNGGQLTSAKKDVEYYYDNLENYVDNIYALLDRYAGAQQKLSQFIRDLGGSGKVHGCIIDVDSGGFYSFTHLYLNPIDGKVTPYFAYDMKERTVYKDFRTLLENNKTCTGLLENYEELEEQEDWNPPEMRYGKDLPQFDEHGEAYDKGNYIYGMSGIIKKLQYCFDKNVVRLWNEKLLNHKFEGSLEGKLNGEDLLESD